MANIAIVRVFVSVIAFTVFAVLANLTAVHAQSIDDGATSWHQKTSVEEEPSAENWVGGEGYRRAASLYSGVTWSPFSNLRQDGLRIRAITGQGMYSYAGGDYHGTSRFIDLLLGWQLSKGGTTIKVFGGTALTSNTILPFDPSTQIQGNARGIKGVIEIWHNWNPKIWSSLDLSQTSSHAITSAQFRTGWRLDDPAWSVGPEAGVIAFSDQNFDVHSRTYIPRLGLFVRYEDLTYEFTISGGVSSEVTQPVGHQETVQPRMGYATVQYLNRF